jgi:hypothetical protein
MLYRLITREGNPVALEPQPFKQIGALQKIEKDLETLLAGHLDGMLFEDPVLMPVFQERPLQPEADLYALNREGDLVIFELKVGIAGEDAVGQILRYAQAAGRWTYEELDRRYRQYTRNDDATTLQAAHQNVFELERCLLPSEFNRRQHLMVIGNAANEALIRAVDYWKRQGLSAEFIPYRVYQIEGHDFFEFFSLPYDRHTNPGSVKGVLFDTNRSWDYLSDRSGGGCLRDMLTKSRVAAYGDRKEAVSCVQKGDYVFYSHKGRGIVGAAKVGGRKIEKVTHPEYGEEWYWDVDLLTDIPRDFSMIPAMGFEELQSFLGKGFYWARIDKRPYLSREESERLVGELKRVLVPDPTTSNVERPVPTEEPVDGNAEGGQARA